MNKQFKTVDEYIATFPDSVRAVLEEIRRTIKELAPEATEAISYQLPTFKLRGRNLIHFGAWQDHIGIYPVPTGTESFRKELAPYVKGKGTIQFQLSDPIPYDLVKKIVALRVEDVSKKEQETYRHRK
jgi:uncharacterized protein YdhG (YjbR/CyaY superfamily)